jgi:hypothetical protein
MKIALVGFALLISACSHYEVDTAEKWCSWITDENALEKHTPFWSVVPSFSFNADAIRNDFALTLDGLYMQKIENRSDRMVWVDQKNLHLYSLSSFFVLSSEEFDASWREPLDEAKHAKYRSRTDPGVCVFGTVSMFFDHVYIHHLDFDTLGTLTGETITEIDNERPKRAKALGSHTLTL